MSPHKNSERPRRLRNFPLLRDLVAETDLKARHLVAPLFLKENLKSAEPVISMPGVMQYPASDASKIAAEWFDRGVRALLLFGIPSNKAADGHHAFDPNGPVPNALRDIKNKLGDKMLLIADTCLCEYTDHGHCGLVHGNKILNDATLPQLAKAAVCYAQAGADVIAPSDMMDGRVAVIRAELDQHGFSETPILSYSVKYASALYGPFRDAAENTPTKGDRKTYQMDTRNRREALREASLDEREGADMLMVKPAGWYLDIISDLRAQTKLPIVGYQVSGEYSLIKLAGANGFMDEKKLALESLYSLRRAGCDFIISYFAPEAVTWPELK